MAYWHTLEQLSEAREEKKSQVPKFPIIQLLLLGGRKEVEEGGKEGKRK